MDYYKFNNKVFDNFDIKSFLNNDYKSNIIKFILFLIIFILLLEETIRLSLFVLKYDYTYDYGELLKKICGYEYMEYETSRFQLSNLISNDNIQLDFDKFNKSNHLLIILIISIIISIIISLTTAYIINDALFEFKDPDNENLKYDLNKNNLFIALIHGIKVILFIFIICIIPTEIILYLVSEHSINPFITNIIDYRIYITIFIILLIIKLPFIKDIDIFKLNKSNDNISLGTYYLYLISFCLIFYFISNFIYIYKNEKNINNLNEKFKKNKLNEYDIDNNFMTSFLKKIIGIYSFDNIYLNNKSKINNTLPKDFSNYIIYFIISIIVILIIIYIIIPYSSNYGNYDFDIIYNTLFIPLLIFVIISLILVSTYEYNTYINNYILHDIDLLYSNDINNINNVFNNIIRNDKSHLNSSSSVPKNIVNPINLVLYKNIFKTNILHNLDLRNDIENIDNIDLTPEYIYENSINDNKFIDYIKLKEYNIAYYLYNKKQNFNIFYNNDKCESINNDVIINFIMNNIIPNIDDNIDNEKIISDIRLKLKDELLNAIYNVNIYGLNYSGNTKLKYNEDFNNNNKLENIIKKQDDKNKDDTKQELYDTYKNLIDKVIDKYILYLKDNIILTKNLIYNLKNCLDDTDETNEINLNSYIDYRSKIIELLSNDNINNINIKKEYIDKSLLLLKNTFDYLNIIYTSIDSSRNQNELTSLIINNYNKVNLNNKYNDKEFISIMPKFINNDEDMKIIYKEFYDIVDIIKDNLSIFNDLVSNDFDNMNNNEIYYYIINNLTIINNQNKKIKNIYNSEKYTILENQYKKYNLEIPPKLINEIVSLDKFYNIIYNYIYNIKDIKNFITNDDNDINDNTDYTKYKELISLNDIDMISIQFTKKIDDFKTRILENEEDNNEPSDIVRELYSKSLKNNCDNIGILSPFIFSVYITSIIIIKIFV